MIKFNSFIERVNKSKSIFLFNGISNFMNEQYVDGKLRAQYDFNIQ